LKAGISGSVLEIGWMIQIPEPVWMKNMADDLYLSSSEVINAFACDQNSCVNKLISQGAIPPPAKQRKRNTARNGGLYWKVFDLRKVFIRD